MKHNCEREIFENTLFWKSDILTRFLKLGLERGEKKGARRRAYFEFLKKKQKTKKPLVSFKGELSIQVVQITICNYISVH